MKLLFFIVSIFSAALLVILGPLSLLADDQIRFDRVNLGEGTIQHDIVDIVQDHNGYMWFASRLGLIRYDGYVTKIYKHRPDDPNSLSSSIIRALCVDADNRIWIASQVGTIDRLDPEADAVSRLEIDSVESNAAEKIRILDICSDKNGRIWMSTSAGGLHFFDESSARFVTFTSYAEGSHDLSDSVILQIQLAADNELLLSVTGEGPFTFDPISGDAQQLGSGTNASPWRSEWGDAVLHEGRDGRIWIGSWGSGLFRYRRGSEDFEKFESAGFPSGIRIINSIYEDREGNIWVVPLNAGVLRIDARTNEVIHLRNENNDPTEISSNNVDVVFQDASGAMWFGSAAGADTYSKYKYKFSSRKIDPARSGGAANYVLSIMEDSSRDIWAGTLSGGLTRIDRSTGRVMMFPLPGEDEDGATAVYALLEDSGGYFYLGTSGMGLLRFSPETATVERLTAAMQVTSIVRDASGNIWFGTFVEGLGKYSPETGDVEFWNPNAGVVDSASFDVTTLLVDSTGAIWIGSQNAGAIKFDPGNNTYLQFFHEPRNHNSISHDHVFSIVEDSLENIWVGTENGLNRIDPSTNFVTRFYEGELLSDNVICGMLEDENRTLWISSYNGMVKFDPAAGISIIYGRLDGLQDAKFNRGACFKSSNGEMFFGGINGFTSFIPHEIRANPLPPPVVITRFRNIDRDVPLKTSGMSVPQVELSYDERLFSLEFAALDYNDPPKNRYRYRLVNHENDWIDSRGARTVTYSQIPPGEYFFEVRGSNNDGVWSEEPASVRIVIVPPFWMTLPFRVFVVLFAVVAVAGFYKMRTSMLKKQRAKLEVEVAERRIAEGQLLRSQSHLRGLAARLTIAEEIERKRIARALHDDVGHAMLTSKLKLINCIEDIEAAEEKKPLDSVVNSLNATIKIIRSLTVQLSPPALHKFGLESAAEKLLDTFGQENRIKTVFRQEQKSPLSESTAMLLYQSLRELLINILKHAEANTVQLSFISNDECLTVTLADNGVGFNVEQAMNADGEMAHYGLFSIQERMESIGGKLELDSKAGEGTTVRLVAPLDKRKDLT